MTFSPANSKAAYLPTSEVYPEETSQLLIKLTSVQTDTAKAVNLREIAQYETVELLTGQQWFGATPQQKRSVYRKVFEIGAIATGGTLTQAHGISGLNMFTRVYGTVLTAVPDYRTLPYTSVGAANIQTEIRLDTTNFYIFNGAAAPAITSGLLVLEYLKN